MKVISMPKRKPNRDHAAKELRRLLDMPSVSINTATRRVSVTIDMQEVLAYDSLVNAVSPVDLMIATHVRLRDRVTASLNARLAQLLAIKEEQK